MSTIAATTSSPSESLLSLLNSSASAKASPAPSTGAHQGATTTTSTEAPATQVELSDRAKAVLARDKIDRVAADRLAQFVAAEKGQAKDKDKPVPASSSATDDGSTLLDRLSNPPAAQTDSGTQWTAGSKWGDPTMSDAAFIAKHKSGLLGALTGFPPEKIAALQAAIDNGTLKFQKGSEVPGYNWRTVITYSDGPGGQGMSGSAYRPPTGAVKEAIDAGNAIAIWTEDRGNLYVTW